MAGTASPAQHRLALALIVLSLCLWLGLRLGLGIGWGAIDRPGDAEQIPLGIAHGIEDNLSYVTWAQQAKDGLLPFTILHTTEPHPAAFVAPVFVAIGRIAALLDVHPLLVMNLAALGAGALALYFVFRAGLAMGLGGRAALLGMLFTAYGSGLSAAALLLSGQAKWAQGADATYLDLMPSAILPFFPYQGLALATVLALVSGLLRGEARLLRGAPAWPILLLVFTLALLAIAVRPYAPVTLVGVYAGLVVLTWLCRAEPARRRARSLLLLALGAGVGPLALYYHSVAGQPVWEEFAAASLELPYTRLDWLIGFGLFWPLAAAGAGIAFKQGRRRCDLISLWAGFVFLLLVVANAGQSKLADGGFVALALLSGHAVDRAITYVPALSRYWRLAALAGLGLFFLASGLSTLALYSRGRGPDYYPVDREILVTAKRIRALGSERVPTVLTEYSAGALLPALASLRVYAGHWSLTIDPIRKVKLLIAAGFEPTSVPGGDEGRREAYSRILEEADFDWVLVHKARPVVPLLESDSQLRSVFRGERWLLFRRAAP